VVHPQRGLVWFCFHKIGRHNPLELASPQCNTNEAIVRYRLARYHWAEVKFMPSVFRRINPHDY
jgi:hypothetical protein